jgi:hypothetical protein
LIHDLGARYGAAVRESGITPAEDEPLPGRLRIAGYLASTDPSTAGDSPPAVPVPRPAPPQESEAPTVLIPRITSEPDIDLGAPEERDSAESHLLIPSVPDVPRRRMRWWLVAVPAVAILLLVGIAVAWHLRGDPPDGADPDLTPPIALPQTDGPVDPTTGTGAIAPGSPAASASRRPSPSSTGATTTFAPPPPPPSPGPALPVKNTAGRCVESADGGRVQLDFCATGDNQLWQEKGGTLTSQGKCLSLADGATANGTRVVVADCTGDAGQQWQKRSDGTWVNTRANRCLDTESGSTWPGARLIVADCKGTTSQRWTMG